MPILIGNIFTYSIAISFFFVQSIAHVSQYAFKVSLCIYERKKMNVLYGLLNCFSISFSFYSFFFCFLCSDKFKIFIHAKYNAISIDLIPLHMRMAIFIKCRLLWSAFLRTFSSYFYQKFLSLTLDSLSISRTYWINVLDNKIILDASEKSVSGQPTTVRCALWTWIDSFLSFSGDESKSETAN